MFDTAVNERVLQVTKPATRWLSTGYDGGFEVADAGYNVTVPTDWSRTDVSTYVTERRREAGFERTGPALLTGVDMRHAHGARAGDVVAFSTVGLSNPARLPVPDGRPSTETASPADRAGSEEASGGESGPPAGTINVILGTTRSLDEAAQANLVATVTEAKTATLLALTGFTGTTTDAVIVGCTPEGDRAEFSGSGTALGDASRACVRDAICASFRSRYEDGAPPASVAEAEYGVVTDRRADVFSLDG